MARKTMKCVFCNGTAKIKYETLELLGGKITLKEQPYYKCSQCKEEFVTSQQMRETEEEINKFSVSRKIVSTGRSLALTIPQELAKFYNLKKGKTIRLIPENKHLLTIRIS